MFPISPRRSEFLQVPGSIERKGPGIFPKSRAYMTARLGPLYKEGHRNFSKFPGLYRGKRTEFFQFPELKICRGKSQNFPKFQSLLYQSSEVLEPICIHQSPEFVLVSGPTCRGRAWNFFKSQSLCIDV